MKSLKRIVGEMVLAAACGAAVGGAFGYSLEKSRERKCSESREGSRGIAAKPYELNRGMIAGGALMGGALCVIGYLYRGNGRKEEEGRNDWDEE